MERDDVIDEQRAASDEQRTAERTGAFDVLYRRHFALVVTVIRGRVSNHEEAEDLAMAVFEIAWAQAAQGKQITLPWLYRCARNVVGNEYQRRDRNGRLHVRLVSDYEANPLVLPVERDIDLVTAIRELSVVDRELIAMVYWYDLTLKEVAEILGASQASVKMRLSRLRKRLRGVLESHLPATKEANTHGRP